MFSDLGRVEDPRAQIYLPHVEGKLAAVSFVTVGDSLFGAMKARWESAKIDQLKKRLGRVIIVPYDFEVCRVYAELRLAVEEVGRPVAANDLWIAACAVRHSIPLLSNNRVHFERIPELTLISEDI